MSLLFAAQNWPFGVALGLIVGIALIEGCGLLLSFSPSDWIDHCLPDPAADGALDRLLGWLHVGAVPLLVLLLLFLTGYAVFGYALQKVCMGLFGFYLPAAVAAVVAVPAGLSTQRALGGLLARIIPKDETSAISDASLIGRAGTISAGIARRGLAAQARVRDSHGRTHFLLVEPDLDSEVFEEGHRVLLVRKVGPFYRCITHPLDSQ